MRRGGLALVTIVFLGALARMWTPQAQTPAGVQPTSILASRGKDTDDKSLKPAATKLSEQWYPVALHEKIRDFFGQEHSPDVIGQQPPCVGHDGNTYYC